MVKKKETAMEDGIRKKQRSKGSLWTIFMHADAVDKWLMTFGLLGAIGDGISTPIMLLVTSKIMNNLGNGPGDSVAAFTRTINENTVSLCYLACGSFVASFLEGYCWSRTGERQAAKMRAKYLKAVLRQDIEYFDLKVASTSEVVTSVSSDSLIIQDVLSEKVPNFIMNTSTFLGSYIVGFFMLWRLALVAFPTVVLLIIPGIMYGRILMSLARKMRAEYDKAGAIAEQAVSSVRTVYSFAAEQRTMSQFSAALDGSVRLGLKQGLAKGIAIGSNGITFAIWAFMVWYGSHLVMYHGKQGGTVFAVGASIVVGGLALGSGLSNVKYFSEACSAGERILEVIRRVPKIDSYSTEGETLDNVTGEVEYQNVEFCYPSRPDTLVFENFNLCVPAGQTVALVGASGSGKSTAIALLERFYDPSGGQILLDGVDIRRLQLRWLRTQMGLVSQEPALFATSIKENILFGKEDATMEDIIAAAKASNAHNFISQLPQGYDTQVGERGVQMSGGQKQRIAIARAIIKSPKILLLDEATSALDSESERIVQEALDKASVGRTTIVIAHRLSTIRNADMIAVVQSGQVVESGSHDELMNNEEGVYTSLVRLQESSAAKEQEHDLTITMSTGALSQSHYRDHSSSRKYSTVSASSSARSFTEETAPTMDSVQREEKPPVPSFRRLLLMNAPEWKQAAVGCLSAIAFGAVQPLYAYAMGSMIAVYFIKDHSEMKRKTSEYSLFFASLSIFSFLINIGQHYNFGAMGEYLTKRVRERMLSKMLTFEVAWFDQDENSTGSICSRLAKDANVVRSLLGDRIALLIQTITAVILAFTLGLVIATKLAAVMIAVQPLIIVCFYARRVILKMMSEKALKSQAESSKLAGEAVSNHRTITAFSSHQRILNLFAGAQSHARRQSRRNSWSAGLGLALSQSLMNLTWALDFWYGGRLVANHSITSEALFQTFMILVSTGRVIADAGSMTTDLAKGSDAVASVFAILDRVTRIDPEDPDAIQPEKITGAIEIHAVDFTYPARPQTLVLRNFSLSIEPGKSTALVGQSGSGKSTVIGIIERFYDPLKGSIKIDGRDIRTFHLRALRKHIGLVGQEPALFAGTVKDNIAYGNENATMEEIEAAARSANAHEFISGLKDGYDTWCGERGAQLSGGQKQRIAIARAIVKNPAILLLDEATSALDSRSERVVQEALERVMVGRTSVVVAHRLSTVRGCDFIAVVDKGSVVEEGNHSSLMAKGRSGVYQQLVSIQQGNSFTTANNNGGRATVE